MTDGTCLAGHAAALYSADDVELLSGIGQCKRLTNDELQGLQTKVVINASAVDRDGAVARNQSYSGNRMLSSAGTVVVCYLRFVHNSRLLKTHILQASVQHACALRP